MSNVVAIRIVVHSPVGVFHSEWFEKEDVESIHEMIKLAANGELRHFRFRSETSIGITSTYTMIPEAVLANSVIITEEISDE